MIRRALPREAAALGAFAARLFRETYAGRVPDADVEHHVAQAFHRDAVLADLSAPGHAWLVAEETGRLAGYAQLRPAAPPVALPFERPVELARFYVDAPHQGWGLAQRLFEAARAWARAQGHDGLWLQVWEESPRALRFYAKQNLQVCGETTYQVGTQVYRDQVMAFPLRAQGQS